MERTSASTLEQMFADVADAGTYGRFEYRDISVGLHIDEADMLARFSTYFGSYFTVTSGNQTDAAVYSSRDPAVFQRLKEWATLEWTASLRR